jgi:hypothetical protein
MVPRMTRLFILGVAGAALLAAACGDSIAAVRSPEAKTPAPTAASGGSSSVVTPPAPAATFSATQTSPRAAAPSTPGVVHSTSLSRPAKVRATAKRTSGPRNRLIGPGLNVGVSIYRDCTGRAKFVRSTVAIDTCMTWDIYFIGHSFGGPFTSLTHARNGETFNWFDSYGVAHRYTIKGHQYTYAFGPPDSPPPGTTAQFQTCLTPNGSRIITYYAMSP